MFEIKLIKEIVTSCLMMGISDCTQSLFDLFRSVHACIISTHEEVFPFTCRSILKWGYKIIERREQPGWLGH